MQRDLSQLGRLIAERRSDQGLGIDVRSSPLAREALTQIVEQAIDSHPVEEGAKTSAKALLREAVKAHLARTPPHTEGQ